MFFFADYFGNLSKLFFFADYFGNLSNLFFLQIILEIFLNCFFADYFGNLSKLFFLQIILEIFLNCFFEDYFGNLSKFVKISLSFTKPEASPIQNLHAYTRIGLSRAFSTFSGLS